MNILFDILKQNGAADVACIKYSDCEIINQRLADRLDFEPKSVIVATVPYYTEYCEQPRSVSAYALAYDYHLLIKEIAESSIDQAGSYYPDFSFKYFADHSPINEKEAAAKAGLGIIGSHSLLITPRHSSFVFIFEILTDMECDSVSKEISYCSDCQRCVDACPTLLKGIGACLSSVTQKKGELTESEVKLISDNGCVWGCDICQTVCPHTQSAITSGTIFTDHFWFNENICLNPDKSSVGDDTDFIKRAYSWRGKETILRNIKIINGSKND